MAIFNQQSEYTKERSRLQEMIQQKQLEAVKPDSPSFWRFMWSLIWDEVSEFIFKTDEDGEFSLNSKGRRRVDWLRIILNVGKLVAKIEALNEVFHKQKS